MTIQLTHVTVIMPAVSEADIYFAINGIELIQQHGSSNYLIVRWLDDIKRILAPFATPLQR